MKAKGIVYGLGGFPRYRGMIRVATGWVHVLEGGEECAGLALPTEGSALQTEAWYPLARATSVHCRQVSRIEWYPSDRQIRGQTHMAMDGSQ